MSRPEPHTTRQVEKYFDTIVRVDGFSENSAREYAFRIIRDDKRVEQILKFNPTSRTGYEGESGSDSGSDYVVESDAEDESEGEDDDYEGEQFIQGDGEGAQNSESDNDDKSKDESEVESEESDSENERARNDEGENQGASIVESSFKSRLYKTPMLLSLMCFLAKNDKKVKVSFTKPEEKGLIYYKMIRCMYSMYCEREG